MGHLFSGGFSVIGARDPRDLAAVGFHPAPHGTWNIHLQPGDDLLLVSKAEDPWKEFPTEGNQHQGPVATPLSGTEQWRPGMNAAGLISAEYRG